mmetsp:Transcript_13337/g.31567  ORF Transcript_13337/g.31567 Transcript_13337/m.31567 type:complete len:126 (+) Transcript_13337:573-950(+)
MTSSTLPAPGRKGTMPDLVKGSDFILGIHLPLLTCFFHVFINFFFIFFLDSLLNVLFPGILVTPFNLFRILNSAWPIVVLIHVLTSNTTVVNLIFFQFNSSLRNHQEVSCRFQGHSVTGSRVSAV